MCRMITKMPVSASDADCGGRQVQRGGPPGAEGLPGRDWGHVRPQEASGPRGPGRRHRRQEEVDAKLRLHAAGGNPNFEFFGEIDTARPESLLPPPTVNLHSRLEVNQHRLLPSFLPSFFARRSSGHGSARVLGSRYRRRRRRRELVNFLERN